MGKNEAERTISAVGLVTAAALLGDSMVYMVLPVYWREAGLDSLWQVGALLAVNRFVRLPLNPLIGWLYRHMSLKMGLHVAVLLGAATTIGYGVGRGFAVWLALRAVWGIAWSLLRIGGFLTVIETSDVSNRGRLMGRYNGVWRLGSLAGVLVGGLLVPQIGLRPVGIAFGALALVGLPLVAAAVRTKAAADSRTGRYDSKSRPEGPLWTIPVTKIVLCGLVVALVQAVFGATLTYVIDKNYVTAASFAGLAAGSTAIGGALTALRCAWEPFLAGWIGRRTDGPGGRLPWLLLSLVGAAAAFAFIPWELPLVCWVAAVLLAMATATTLGTIMDAMAADAVRNGSAAKVMTAYSVSTDLGAAIGPVVVFGAFGAQYGLQATYILCAMLFIAVGVAYGKPFMERRRAADGIESDRL
ncbi:MFS transporter [Cohnella sp. GCM10020058]|uniref:MFS transporter n=1 Tax=Cohnella sp. GCM10020058 TaxID=3317330 RepID=UPI0036343823